MTAGKETVNLDEAKEQVKRVSLRLGLLHLSFARTLVDELGEKKGKEVILKAIKDYGTRIGEKMKAEVMAQGLDNSPANFKGDLPQYGMNDRRETVAGETSRCIYGCVMGKLWNELGEGELGRLYCLVDPAKYMAYNPNFKLTHSRALPDGDEYCELAVRPTTEQERKDFADKDKDWSYIDR